MREEGNGPNFKVKPVVEAVDSSYIQPLGTWAEEVWLTRVGGFPGDFNWGREAHGVWMHFPRRVCANGSRIPSWVSSNEQWKSNEVIAFRVQMGSENCCGEDFRSETGREWGSESWMIEKKIYLTPRFTKPEGSSPTWCLLYIPLWAWRPGRAGVGRLSCLEDMRLCIGVTVGGQCVYQLLWLFIFIWCLPLAFWYLMWSQGTWVKRVAAYKAQHTVPWLAPGKKDFPLQISAFPADF